jgi:hypothetical protein
MGQVREGVMRRARDNEEVWETPRMHRNAPAQIFSASGVRECTTVTVASRFWSSSEAGRPTMFERPTTTARLPEMGTL